MRLYIQNIEPSCFTNNSFIHISDCIQKKEYISSYIYSYSGIYNISKKGLSKLKYNDGETQYTTINNHTAIIDTSTITLIKDEYQIPIPSVEVNIKRVEYVIKTNTITKFIIESIHNKCIQCYFESQHNIIPTFIDDVTTFLSHLKFY